MARKKSSLSAFENAMSEFGFDNPMGSGGTSDMDDIFDSDDIDDLTKNEPTGDHVDQTEGNGDDVNIHDDDSDIPEDILNNNNTPGDQLNDNGEQDVDHVDPAEAEQIGAFFDAFAEELGWDVEGDNKPDSIPALIDYIKDVVDQNSTPSYADQRVQQLDEYIKNGGKFEDFYQKQQEAVSYSNMDMEDESNQKAAVRDFLRYQGYTDDQINRKIERYEDSDMLEEEAEDAVARLQQIHEQQLAIQQQQQEEARQAQEQQAREFMTNLTQSIGSLDSIRGISIPKADRKALFDYITKTDADGLTRYQKDFNENLVNNLIESAYFTMKGDALLGEAKRSGRTSAADKLRTMLRHSSTNHTRYNVDENKQRSVVDIASQFYR